MELATNLESKSDSDLCYLRDFKSKKMAFKNPGQIEKSKKKGKNNLD